MPPGLSLAGARLVVPDHGVGLPVLRALSLCTCRRQYPGTAAGRRLRSSHPAISAFPETPVGSACTSSFSRSARRSLALRPAHVRRSPNRDQLTEGFSHFVASMTAPVASGWSELAGWDSHPLEMRRLVTAHGVSGHSMHRLEKRESWSVAAVRLSVISCRRFARRLRLLLPHSGAAQRWRRAQGRSRVTADNTFSNLARYLRCGCNAA
jgi:hypothetical protein